MTDAATRLGIADRLEEAMRGGYGSVRIFESDEQAQLTIDTLRAASKAQEPVAWLYEYEGSGWHTRGATIYKPMPGTGYRNVEPLYAGDTKSDGARSNYIPDTEEEANERGDIEGTGGKSYYRPSDTPPPADAEIREAVIATLTNVAQIIDVVKGEWQPEGCWSEWDQSVRDDITKLLRTLSRTDAEEKGK